MLFLLLKINKTRLYSDTLYSFQSKPGNSLHQKIHLYKLKIKIYKLKGRKQLFMNKKPNKHID